ncbi:glutamic acid-rich protein-like [Cotesia glomerata]|uniref:glutamic acid-rich protein-like n=1 Tax=Cotesia glomerata TaxID=32391 RepID=UPI001D02AA85|nr:glutamic acid-rich protein-like [Cotesia glomerata]XP_044579944.1 glutamic acid-rich protein-like [Cotesia glomerata]XP_044579945.1 glutamic acid-rich protein-like [Cotesia glomerata]XP_044579946.1 glutamic acid-rich protein-like [Cotesia glomerata]XP_044579948.1 glutamic acid-rich protein-like [Cotesia glomerata]XP_044579949.1 glutamic acid-rich protein-like [Cotesia glomerata]XP_044579950.1 glutamic acid-rich protein-like [Cotesia glomerata]
MDKENFKTAVDIKPATGFVNNMARFIFGLETLRKSTVTGESSRRKRKENDDTNLEKPLKLPVDGIKTLRGIFKYYLDTSPWYKNLDLLAKDHIHGKLGGYLSKFIANLKAPKRTDNRKIHEDGKKKERNNNKTKGSSDREEKENQEERNYDDEDGEHDEDGEDNDGEDNDDEDNGGEDNDDEDNGGEDNDDDNHDNDDEEDNETEKAIESRLSKMKILRKYVHKSSDEDLSE